MICPFETLGEGKKRMFYDVTTLLITRLRHNSNFWFQKEPDGFVDVVGLDPGTTSALPHKVRRYLRSAQHPYRRVSRLPKGLTNLYFDASVNNSHAKTCKRGWTHCQEQRERRIGFSGLFAFS